MFHANGDTTDARPHLEYAISHIPGALNVSEKPGVPISVDISDVAEIGRAVSGNEAAPIVLYCNGPFCGKSKRLSEELVAAGYTNVRRYQLGIPVWRALVGITEIRIIVFGSDGAQARAVAEAVAREAFHNLSYFPGTFDALKTNMK